MIVEIGDAGPAGAIPREIAIAEPRIPMVARQIGQARIGIGKRIPPRDAAIGVAVIAPLDLGDEVTAKLVIRAQRSAAMQEAAGSRHAAVLNTALGGRG